jgi:sec-independent protein translocase protein TatC
MPVREHLRELRNRLAKAALALVAGTVVGWLVHDRLIAALTGPACAIAHVHGIGQATPACPNGLLVLAGVLTPLTFTFKVAMLAGVVISSPVWSYQLWAFAAPGLHRAEKRYSLLFTGLAVPLFLTGAALAYWTFPQGLRIILGFTPKTFSNSIPGDQFLDFFLRMILLFGFSFELPLLLVLLNALGVLPGRTLTAKWRPIVFGVFVFSALATPTGDPFTMLVLAVPMTALFGVAVAVICWRDAVRARREREADAAAPGPDEAGVLDLSVEDIGTTEPVAPRSG